MNGKALMRERAMLIGWKYSHGLTADEATRLEFLNAEALRRYPRVTPARLAVMPTMPQRYPRVTPARLAVMPTMPQRSQATEQALQKIADFGQDQEPVAWLRIQEHENRPTTIHLCDSDHPGIPSKDCPF